MGGGLLRAPLWFLGYSVFGTPPHTSSYILSAHVKILDLGHSKSGHQVTSSDLISEKNEWWSQLLRLNDHIETFSE